MLLITLEIILFFVARKKMGLTTTNSLKRSKSETTDFKSGMYKLTCHFKDYNNLSLRFWT